MNHEEIDAEIPVTKKELLLKVWNFIAPNPELHDQQRWAEVHDLAVANNGVVMVRSTPDQYVDLLATPLAPEIQCGTTACVAGWTVALAGDKFITNTKTFLAMAMFPWWWWVSVEMARVWWRSRHA